MHHLHTFLPPMPPMLFHFHLNCMIFCSLIISSYKLLHHVLFQYRWQLPHWCFCDTSYMLFLPFNSGHPLFLSSIFKCFLCLWFYFFWTYSSNHSSSSYKHIQLDIACHNKFRSIAQNLKFICLALLLLFVDSCFVAQGTFEYGLMSKFRVLLTQLLDFWN